MFSPTSRVLAVALAAVLLPAASATAQKVSLSPTIGVYFPTSELIKAANELGRTMRTTIHVTSYDALCFMVETGLGIGIMPRAVAEPYRRTLGIAVLSLEEPWARRQLKICVRSMAALPVAAQLLVAHLRAAD